MSIKQICVGAGDNSSNTGVSGFSNFHDIAGLVATEAHTPQYLRVSGGTYSRLSTYVSANTATVSMVLNFRKNSADGNQTITITSSTTGLFQDTSNSDSCSTDDLVNYKLTSSSGSGAVTLSYVSIVSAPSSNWRAIGKNIRDNLGNSNIYRGLGNNIFDSATESITSFKMRQSGTFKKLMVYCNTNANASNVSIWSRINSADGTLTATVTAMTTGLFEDTTHTDTVASGDLCNFKTSNVGATSSCVYLMYFLSDDASYNQIISTRPNTAIGSAATNYYPICGGGLSAQTNENNSAIPVDFDYTIKNFELNVRTNATTSNSTADLRVNSSSPVGGPAITITSATTGYFNDLSTTYTGASGDKLDTRIVNGGGGNLNIQMVGYTMTEVQSSSTGRANRLSLLGVC